MRLAMKTRGAVSIFLVLILVPMIIVSGLFVDASKLYLGRSVTESAGDLALNTALTDYDTKLKDMYGLFATAQDTDELFDKLEDYYKTCITSSGVNGAEADLYVDRIMAQLGIVAEGDDTADILNMQLVDFTVEKKAGTSLDNPAILKKQIVDFMKYRAPINMGMSFLSSLKSFNNLDKQTELVNKRTEYYKQQQTVMEKLKEAWKKIREYEKTNVVTNENYFPAMLAYMNGIKGKYEADNAKTIKDLYDTQSYIDYYCSISQISGVQERDANGNKSTVNNVWRLTYSKVAADPLDDYTNDTYYKKYNKNKLPETSDIKTLMQTFYSSLSEVEACEGSLLDSTNNKYELQYLVQRLRSGKLTNYTNKLVNLYTAYQDIKNAMIWVEGYNLNGVEKQDKDGNPITAESIKESKVKLTISGTNYTKKISEHFVDIENKFDKQMKNGSSNVSTFSSISENIKAANATDTSGVDADVKGIAAQVNQYVSDMETAASALENAANMLQEAINLINGDLNTAKNNWSTAADESSVKNTSMAKQDQAEIENLGEYFNTSEIDELKTRLSNIAAKLRENINQIKSYKFDGKFVGEIQSYSDLKSVISGKCGDSALKSVPLNNDALNNKVASWFGFDFTQIKTDWITQSGKQINLKADKLKFYTYLYSHFMQGEETEASEDTENGKGLYDSIKSTSSEKSQSQADKTKTDETTGSGEIADFLGESRPSKENSESTPGVNGVSTGDTAVSDTSSGLNGLFSKIADFGRDLRDNLYVSEYILTMFSYDAMAKEWEEKGKEAPKKTLTLQEISETNNYAYGSEVEYILYGGKNSENKVKAYATIFGIRLAFNLIYAFSDSSIRDTALAIATPISAATLGVIPVPLIQAAIIIGIACCESAIDICDLKNGKAVPLFKNNDSWRCSIQGLIESVKDAGKDFVSEAANETIDKGYAKLSEYLDMTDEKLTEIINKGGGEITGSIESAFDDMITRHASTAIQKLTTLINNEIEEAKKKENVATEQIKANVYKGLDDWLKKENVDDNIAHVIEEAAVEAIKSVDAKINELIEQFRSSATESIENAEQVIMSRIDEIKDSIVKKVNESCDKVKDMKTQLKNKVKDAMNEGTEKLKDTVSNGIDELFGSSSGNASDGDGENTGAASLLSFTYSDYLRLFLVIGLFKNDGEAIYLRTADVIQANMRHQGMEDFLLSNSAVYVDINATVLVKPTFLALPLFSNLENNPKDDSSWYTVTYKDTRGY